MMRVSTTTARARYIPVSMNPISSSRRLVRIAAITIAVATGCEIVRAQRLPDDDPVYPRYRERLHQVDSLSEAGRLHEAIATLEELRSSHAVRSRIEDYGSLLMRLARAYGEVGDSRRSIERVREAYEHGVRVLPALLTDECFVALGNDSTFQRLVANARAQQVPWESQRIANAQHSRWHDSMPVELQAYGLSAVWSAVNYGFAYRDRMMLNWDSIYVAALRSIAAQPSPYAYHRRLQRMLARLGDGHTAVAMPSDLVDSHSYFPPIRTSLIEDRVIVTSVLEENHDAATIAIGDEILAIDGIDVRTFAAERIAPWVSASSPQDLAARPSSERTAGLIDHPRDRQRRDTCRRETLVRRWCWDDVAPSATVGHAIMRSSIGYCAINTFGDEYVVELFERAMVRLWQSRALVIDLRRNTGGHSRLAFEVLSRLMDSAFATHAWETPMHRAYLQARGRSIEWHR